MSELINAVINNDIDLVRQLLDQGADPNIVFVDDEEEMTALIIASYRERIEIVRLLLDRSADPNVQNDYGNTALISASRGRNIDTVRLLLDNGADLDIQNDLGWTALFMASYDGTTEMVQILLEYGADLDIQDNDGDTALIISSMNDIYAIVNTLLSNGADPNIKNLGGNTALMLASKFGNTEIVQLLLEYGVNANIQNNDGATALTLASAEGYLEVVELLERHIYDPDVFESPSSPDINQLKYEAARTIQRRIKGRQTRRKLTKKSPKYGKMESPTTEREKMRRWTDLTKMYSEEDPIRGYEQFSIYPERLLPGQKGGTKQIGGNNELFDAVENDEIDRVRQLLERGADINHQNDEGMTALMYAAHDGHTEIFELLLDNGAHPNIRDLNGNTALSIAEDRGHPEIVKMIIWNNYALIEASELGNIDMVRQLLDDGVDPDFQMDSRSAPWPVDGDSALITASRNGFINIVELLLDKGANPNLRDADDNTALIHASEYGHIEIVELLLNRGAIPNIPNRLGITALRVAELTGHNDIERLLKRHMDITRMQSNIRGKRTRRKIRGKQQAEQTLSLTKGMHDPSSTYSKHSRYVPGITEIISKHLSKKPYSRNVSTRMREEEENERMADYLDTLYEDTDSDDDYSLAYDDGAAPAERRKSQAQRPAENLQALNYNAPEPEPEPDLDPNAPKPDMPDGSYSVKQGNKLIAYLSKKEGRYDDYGGRRRHKTMRKRYY